MREAVSRVVSDLTAVVTGLGEPRRAEVRRLYSAADLTILNVIWGPRMTIMPHNHLMWAVIGIYSGREGNIFRRRLTDEPSGRVEAAGAKSLGERDAEPLGRDIIHSVTNPLSRLTGAIRVYGGDFFAVFRSDWDPETLLERTMLIRLTPKSTTGSLTAETRCRHACRRLASCGSAISGFSPGVSTALS